MRKVIGIVGVVAAIWVLLVVLAALFQRQLIYLPDASEPSPPPGSSIEQIIFETHDGLTHEAWFLPASAGSNDGSATTIVVTPGNAGNRASRVPMANGLVERGYNVVLLDYRGYGGNPGSPTEDDLVADAVSALEQVAARDDVDRDRIAYLGESIGGGVASALATEVAPAALVLRSPFPELADVGRSAYPFLPVGTLLRDRFPIAEDLAAYDGPVLVVAGGADRIVPTELSRQVAAEAEAEYVEIEGVGHNDAALFTGERFLDEVASFLDEVVQATED